MKIKSILPCSLILTGLAGIQLAAQATGTAAPKEISVNDPRPVAAALDILEKQYHVAITYEDPEFTNPHDIQEDPRDKIRTDGRTYFFPHGGTLQFQYVDVGNEPQEGITPLITRMLNEYASSSGPEFEVKESKTFRQARWDSIVWHVIPVRWRNSEGRIEAQPAILDTLISIPKDDRNGVQMLVEICAQLTAATGIKVGVGMIPMNMLMGWHGNVGFDLQPARDILEKFLNGKQFLGGLLDWRLFYVPRMYALNIGGPSPPSVPVTAAQSHPVSPRNSRGQGNLPFPSLYSRLNTPAGISAFQAALAKRGYYQGAPTGQWDQKTIAAMQAFQAANGLPASTWPDPRTLHLLNPTSVSTLPHHGPR